MDLQKITSTGTAVAVLGTGAVVGGNHVIDQQRGGPERRETERIELIRKVVSEELYLQLKDAFPLNTGNVTGIQQATKDYRNTIPKN